MVSGSNGSTVSSIFVFSVSSAGDVNTGGGSRRDSPEAGFGEVPGGTLYPALLRLEKQGFIGSSRVPSALGPVRKYYELTRAWP